MKNDNITETVKTNITTYSSTMLCRMILVQKSFNLNKDLTILCMGELARRRESGDLFNFEQFLDENKNLIPKLSFAMDLNAVQSIFSGLKK